MANSITNILDKILARGLMTLREAAVMPRLVNVDFNADEGRQFGNTIDVPKPVPQTASALSPGAAFREGASKTPELVQISLDQWKTTEFFLNDKEMTEIDRNRHFIPMQTDEAARALANDVDVHIHGNFTKIFGFVGTGGVVPFSTVATATDTRKVLNEQLAPMNDRRIVMDPTAESQALQLSAYSDVEKTDDRAVKIEGEIGRKFGMDHFMSQNVQTHTAGTGQGENNQISSTTAVNSSTLGISGTSTLGTIVVGDVFTIAGDTQTYVSKSAVTITSAGVDVTIAPKLKVIASSGSLVTIKATHVVNLGFQRNAFAYVTRPIADSRVETGNAVISQMTDDMTGLTLRLEMVRQRKQTTFEFDILYGSQLMRPELATRIAG